MSIQMLVIQMGTVQVSYDSKVVGIASIYVFMSSAMYVFMSFAIVIQV